MFRIVVLAIAMLLIGAALALSESSEGIRIVSARDLLNYAEMPTFRDAVLDRIKHTENGVSWGMLVSKKDLYCTRRWRLSKSSRLWVVTRKTIRRRWIGIGNW